MERCKWQGLEKTEIELTKVGDFYEIIGEFDGVITRNQLSNKIAKDLKNVALSLREQ